MTEQPKTSQYNIRPLATPSDFDKISHLWQTIFPGWPIAQPRLQALLRLASGLHYIHDAGFCLSFLPDGANGKIAALGVLPDHRGKGLGTALLERAKQGMRDAAEGGELKSLEVGSQAPRFWPQMPRDVSQEAKEFFVKRGFRASGGAAARDLFKDIRSDIAPPEIMERVAKTNVSFSPWSPELSEECITKQRALFSWHRAYEILAARNQHHEVLVAFDPETKAQIGWTLMCSPSSLAGRAYAFLPLMPSGEKTGLIAAVGVDEGARGKGVGLAMVVRAMESLRERGVEGVFIDSVFIRGFYERLGFETVWEYEAYVEGG